MRKTRISLLVSGASGHPIFIKLLECLLIANCYVQVVFSKDALISFAQEMDCALSSNPEHCRDILINNYNLPKSENLIIYGNADWYSPLASGSGAADYTIVCPCSMSSLAKIAYGISESLLLRAVDVAIKESKPVLIVPRETPLSAIHLENMLKLANIGVRIIPPVPAFYTHPKSVSDIILFIVVKIMDQINLDQPRLIPEWGNN